MNTLPVYSIVGWNDIYENSRSRTVKSLDWVPVPNKHDGEGFATVMAHNDAAEIYAAWHLILQVASKCKTRGVLVNKNGVPYTAQSLAVKTRGKASWFEKALEFLSSEEVGWIQKTHECQCAATQLTPPRQDDDTQVSKKEGKGKKEENITREEDFFDDPFTQAFTPIAGDFLEEGDQLPEPLETKPPKRSSSIPPKRQDVVSYFEELMAANPEDEADAFMDYWAARDWKNSRGKMKDWEATVRTWKRNQIEYGKWQEKKIVLIPVEGVDYKIKYWQEGDTCGTHWNIDDSGPFMEPVWKAKKLAEMQGGKK